MQHLVERIGCCAMNRNIAGTPLGRVQRIELP
jgi:hypothetical protein